MAMANCIDPDNQKTMADNIEADNQFVSLLTMHQSQLRGFILASLGNHSDAMDVLQRTNMTLWKKAELYRRDAPFLPWAFGIARYEILGYLRDRNRERVVFETDVIVLMCETAADELDNWPDRQQALHRCLEKLEPSTRQIFDLRYAESRSVKYIAQATNRSIDSIKSLMLRSRRSLRLCIEQRLAENG